jgi:hypothetical protein
MRVTDLIGGFVQICLEVFRGGHMNVMVAAFDVALLLLAAIVLGVEVPYWGYRAIHGLRVYLKFRGTRLVTCPETRKPAVVAVAARSMGLRAILNDPCLHLSECSRWPMRQDCGQTCLRQIETQMIAGVPPGVGRNILGLGTEV